jgi:hypothetical protein
MGKTARVVAFTGAGCAVVAIGVAILFTWRSFDPIGPENYERIGAGMRRDEIEAIIGVPAGIQAKDRPIVEGDFTSHSRAGYQVAQSGIPIVEMRGELAASGRLLQWWGKHYAIEVGLDENGCAKGWQLLKLVP